MLTRSKGFWAVTFLIPIVYVGILVAISLSLTSSTNTDDYVSVPTNLSIFNTSYVRIPSYALVYEHNLTNHSFVQNVSRTLKEMITTELNVEPTEYTFNNTNEFNKWVFNIQKNNSGINLAFGLEIKPNLTSNDMNITILYNSTGQIGLNDTYIQVERVLWKAFGLGNMSIDTISVEDYTQIMTVLIPMFIIFTYTGYFIYVTHTAVLDHGSPKRDYVLNSGVGLFTYWLGTLSADMIIWVIISIINYVPLYIVGTPAFRNYTVLTIISIFTGGIPITILVYCISFLFKDPEKSQLSLMILYLFSFVYYLVLLISNSTILKIVLSIVGLIAPSNLISMLSNLSFQLPSVWSYDPTKITIITMIINYFFYPGLLALFEYLRISIPKKKARKEFLSYQDYFTRIKVSKPSTEEAEKAAREAENGNPDDFVLRVCNVSRLFFDNAKKVVPAVNNVSFGIKSGCIFGFLGSNGAGKTTLLNMITGLVPLSAGTIEVNGQSNQTSLTRNISICPQFNDHLVSELTVDEHIRLFCKLFNYEEKDYIEFRDRFIDEIQLTEHVNKLVSELSGGNARKLAVLLSLLNKSNIVLLDEPTSSLDPIARHRVHDIINSFKGKKTFMLCTHLLDEAESLCDIISIMFHGCIYVVETPQYLSSKFGTEWKVDLLLDDESDEIEHNITSFFTENLPSATLSIKREKNRIYTIPSSDIEIYPLFRLLNDAISRNIGIKFFTCTSSTLEKVFLDLLSKSETEVDDGVPDDEKPLL